MVVSFDYTWFLGENRQLAYEKSKYSLKLFNRIRKNSKSKYDFPNKEKTQKQLWVNCSFWQIRDKSICRPQSTNRYFEIMLLVDFHTYIRRIRWVLQFLTWAIRNSLILAKIRISSRKLLYLFNWSIFGPTKF